MGGLNWQPLGLIAPTAIDPQSLGIDISGTIQQLANANIPVVGIVATSSTAGFQEIADAVRIANVVDELAVYVETGPLLALAANAFGKGTDGPGIHDAKTLESLIDRNSPKSPAVVTTLPFIEGANENQGELQYITFADKGTTPVADGSFQLNEKQQKVLNDSFQNGLRPVLDWLNSLPAADRDKFLQLLFKDGSDTIESRGLFGLYNSYRLFEKYGADWKKDRRKETEDWVRAQDIKSANLIVSGITNPRFGNRRAQIKALKEFLNSKSPNQETDPIHRKKLQELETAQRQDDLALLKHLRDQRNAYNKLVDQATKQFNDPKNIDDRSRVFEDKAHKYYGLAKADDGRWVLWELDVSYHDAVLGLVSEVKPKRLAQYYPGDMPVGDIKKRHNDLENPNNIYSDILEVGQFIPVVGTAINLDDAIRLWESDPDGAKLALASAGISFVGDVLVVGGWALKGSGKIVKATEEELRLASAAEKAAASGAPDATRLRAALKKVDTTALSKAEKGVLGEARMDLTFERAGYEKLPGKLPSNTGFDGVYVKRGANGEIQDIVVGEAKFSATGEAALADTKTMGKQLSTKWINDNIQKMLRSEDAAVREAGRLLRDNRSMVRPKATVLDPQGRLDYSKLQIP